MIQSHAFLTGLRGLINPQHQRGPQQSLGGAVSPPRTERLAPVRVAGRPTLPVQQDAAAGARALQRSRLPSAALCLKGGLQLARLGRRRHSTRQQAVHLCTGRHHRLPTFPQKHTAALAVCRRPLRQGFAQSTQSDWLRRPLSALDRRRPAACLLAWSWSLHVASAMPRPPPRVLPEVCLRRGCRF
eukprot:COSAG01_NODE_12915_length_1664_cov_1.127796_2_plen_186_part_00